MSRFIKVTDKETGIVTLQNAESVEFFGDQIMVCKDGSNMDIKESLEQIEAQFLRDKFANNAMQAILNAITIPEGSSNYDLCTYNDQVANHAYVIADEMLKERMK